MKGGHACASVRKGQSRGIVYRVEEEEGTAAWNKSAYPLGEE
jgi:hypothetical protein